MAVDYDRLLSQGIVGILESLRAYRAALDTTCTADLEKDLFYASCERCLQAVLRLSERYAEEAERQAAVCGDAARAAELREIAAVCRRVPAQPPETFREAVQAVHFLTFCLNIKPLKPHSQQYQFGRPDRYLLPYYERDLAAGRLTRGQAQTLLDCVAVLMNQNVNKGLSNGYMVGGRDPHGHVVSNELTTMLMRVVEQVRLVYPSVGLCWCTDTPAADLRLACEILRQGHSHPAIFNDDVITAGLRGYGLSAEEACHYIHSTCVEITPIGCSNVWVASPYINLMQALLDVLDREYPTMEALYDAYFAHLRERLRAEMIEQNRARLERMHTIDPLLSCFVNDCLRDGRDIEQGGARYNWTMPSFVGLSNVADSLTAIDEMVFRRQRYTFAALQELLANDFAGREDERLELLNAVPKYGNDVDRADAVVQRVSAWLAEECTRYATAFRNGRVIPSLFCWIMHDTLGQKTGAGPDGRKAGFPLGDGSGPAQGREQHGPTASVLSSTKWAHGPFIGGVAVNMKFSKALFRDSSLDRMEALIVTYLRRGGFEMQINVVDRETLLKAQQEPENYRDLIVRIGGYSDYFVRLTPTMQAEVLLRTEHAL